MTGTQPALADLYPCREKWTFAETDTLELMHSEQSIFTQRENLAERFTYRAEYLQKGTAVEEYSRVQLRSYAFVVRKACLGPELSSERA